MRRPSPHLPWVLALALLTSCAAPSGTGSVQFAVLIPQNLSTSVARVTVTASAADMPSTSVELAASHGVHEGLLGGLPAGAHRSLLAQAFDASGTLLLQGAVSDVSLSAHQTVLVALTLQAPGAPPASLDEPPVIDSLVISSTTVPPGGQLFLQAAVHGLYPDEPLDSAWSSEAGSSSSATGPSSTWTAPPTPGPQTLTFTVRNASGRSSSASMKVTAQSSGGQSEGQGAAQVSVSFNSAPGVTAVGATFAQLGVGQATSVSASAEDPEGDSLSYVWSASCAGSWDQTTSNKARFTPSALPAGACDNCDLSVLVSDGRGGQTRGTVSLCVGTAPVPQHFNPNVLRTFSSALPWENAAPGQTFLYEVAANDPEGSALSFSWSANTGSLGTPSSTATNSRITWTAPTCVAEGTTATITPTVTNAFNLTATNSFTVMGLPPCPPSSPWGATNPLLSARTNHTATLLAGGKVLVTGGQNTSGYLAKAEVYDPASGTWSATRDMNSTRHLHAAVLLSTGKVLVSGGYNGSYLLKAEVYDPASGTWSATGNNMSAARDLHTVTPLPGNKVLVTGGLNSTTGYLSASELYVYSSTSGTWSPTGALAAPRAYHTATLLNTGKVLVTGGRDSTNFLATAELYDPASGTWSTTGPMTSPRASHTATLLPDGRVLVTGGTYRTTYLATAELYDPASGTWSAVDATMAWPRANHTATLLPGGKVLVAGGGRGGNVYLAKSEVFNPSSGTWSPADSMVSPHTSHTATLLNTGKVLVTGGSNSNGFLGTAELFTP